MPLAGGDHDAIIRGGGRGDHHVERAARPAGRGTLCHDPRPLHGGLEIEWQNAARKEDLRSFRAGEPCLQFAAAAARDPLENTAPYSRHRQSGDEEVRAGLGFNPSDNRRRRLRLRCFADDIRVE
jgi:hypothetical protein